MNAVLPETSILQSSLLSRMNERRALHAIQTQGPLSRAEVARHLGISAPTASKSIEALLRTGFLEEGEAPELGRGRPAKKLRLPQQTALVLGCVIDVEQCRIVPAGLDGALHEADAYVFPTPESYPALIETMTARVEAWRERTAGTLFGVGVSIPGQIDYREGKSLLSPNVPITNHRAPMNDLAKRLGVPCVMLQESHALCLAEQRYGAAKDLQDFAMLDVHMGVGLGVMSGGKLLMGHRGLAGEVGHITVHADGRRCGCGNYGCLETLASDSALAWEVSQRLERKINIETLVEMVQRGEISAQPELDKICRYLAIGVAAVLNLFNPATLFLHGRMFACDPNLFDRLCEEVKRRALPPSFADCTLVLARGSKRQGAVAGIIEHLMNSLLPESIRDVHYVK